MGRFQKIPPAALMSLLSLAFLIKAQVRGLHIRPNACYNSMGDLGTCMFVWECIKTEGKHLGTCADGFLFGSCCAHNDTNNNLVPESDSLSISFSSKRPTALPVTTSAHGLSTFYPSDSEVSQIYRPSPVKPDVQSTYDSRPPYTKPTAQSTVYSRPSYTKPTVQSTAYSRPSYSKPTVHSVIHTRPPYSKPTVQPISYSRPPHIKPTTHITSYPKPSSTVSPLSIVSVIPSRTTASPFKPVSTSRSPATWPTTTNYGYSSTAQTSDYWFRPTGFTSIYVSTMQPNLPTKVSFPHLQQTSARPTKYPYPRPSWKPQPPSSGLSSTLSTKPQILTSETSHSTRPSIIITKTTTGTKRPVLVTKTTTSKPFSAVVTKAPLSTLKTTISSWPTSKSPTRSPITTSTFRTTIFTKSPTVSSMVTTLKATLATKPPLVTSSRPGIVSVLSSSTQYSWFDPDSHKNTTSKPSVHTEVIVTHWQNSTGIPLEGMSPAQFKPPSTIRPTWKPMTATENVLSGPLTPANLESNVSSVSIVTTTPLPILPCGLPNQHPQQKVVGGKNSAFGSWPWQASVRRTSFFGFSSTHRCGGALISKQWVATAGHCVDDLLLSQIKIRVGEYDFASVQEPHGYVERGAKRKVVHPRYNFFTYENDLALVQLEEAIDSEKYPHISPICLPPSEESLIGRNATVTGWGRLSEGGVLPSILQEVKVPIISNEKCKNMFLAAGRHEYIPDIFMCAGFEEGGRDSCQGDSGGPLQIQSDEGYWFLAGIISWGIGCAEPNMPGVCTRISKFKDWVVQHIT